MPQELVVLRQKYPQYKDMDDISLATAISAKYPQYDDLLDKVMQEQSVVAPEPEQGLTGLGKVLPTFLTGQTPERGERTIWGDVWERPGAAIRGAFLGKKKGIEGFVSGSAVPEEMPTFQQEALKRFAPKTKSVALNFLGGLPASSYGLALDVLTNPADVLSMIVTGPLSPFKKNPAQTATKLKTDKVISGLFNKSVKPSGSGKVTSTLGKRYQRDVRNAVKTIIENKEVLQFTDEGGNIVNRLPQNLDEFSQAITQTKRHLFDTYDDMLKAAGESGAKINAKPIIGKLDDIINNKSIKISSPEAIQEAQRFKKVLERFGDLTPKEANNTLQALNANLGPKYTRPFIPEASTAGVRAKVAEGLRESIDDTVSSVTGKQFQIFKNKYGALRNIEADVNKAAGRWARSAPHGITDMVDAFAAGNIAEGMATGRGGQITKGVTIGIAKNIMKLGNNPNRMVGKMFEAVSKFHSPDSVNIPLRFLGGEALINQYLQKYPDSVKPIIRATIESTLRNREIRK